MNPAQSLEFSLHQRAPFHVGAVVKWPEIALESLYARRALEQFSSFTPERIFKASLIHPGENLFDWKEADAFVDFCEKHGKRLHGHTLAWDHELPAWISNHAGGDETLLKDHITSIAGRYAGRVQGWDVVNEGFDAEGELKDGTWMRLAGEEYLTKAFIWASEADPGALLFYNDFDLDVNEKKRGKVLRHLASLRDSGVRIDGIGLQLHLNLGTARPADIARALREIATEGFQVHLSEIDISVNPYDGTITGKDQLFELQAGLLEQVVANYMEISAAQRYGITFWGVGDPDSWMVLDLRQVDYPLLFDEYYRPKPMCKVLLTLFDNAK